MGLTNKSICLLKQALPVGTLISIVRRNGEAVNSYINTQGFSVSLHSLTDINFYSPFDKCTVGDIKFDSFTTCKISKTHVRLDDCVIAIKKKVRLEC